MCVRGWTKQHKNREWLSVQPQPPWAKATEYDFKYKQFTPTMVTWGCNQLEQKFVKGESDQEVFGSLSHKTLKIWICTLFLKITKIDCSQRNIQRNLYLEIKYYLLTFPPYLYYNYFTLLQLLSLTKFFFFSVTTLFLFPRLYQM